MIERASAQKEIIPAIIPEDLEDLHEKLLQVRGLAPWVQVDVIDGVFAPDPSWPFNSGTGREEFSEIVREEEGLPFWENFEFEVDLMVDHPEGSLEEWISAGFSRLIVHVESTDKLPEIIASTKGRVEVGLAIGIDTPLSVLEPFVNDIDLVQFMGIARIGFQGEPFDERVIHKITEFRSLHPDGIISVDGGVSLSTAPELLKAGATRLVSGSAILNARDTQEAIEAFQELF